jgi:diguanylate cyclase (GGDEF)-like protein
MALLPVIHQLVLAHELPDVRKAIGHGARILSQYDSLTLFERRDDGALHVTLRCGADLGPASQLLEDTLAEAAVKTGGTLSTLDRVADDRDQARLDEYMESGKLCLVRPLRAYGEMIGALALHYDDKRVLEDEEFDSLRRFCDFAAASLTTARMRADLAGYAFTDPLTGLANRRRLESEFDRLANSRLALLLVDFDGLKAVNDTLGYDEGDHLIAEIGTALGALARPDEVVARWGGDEFVIMVEGAEAAHARARAEEITKVLDDMTLPSRLAGLFHGASVGSAAVESGEAAAQALARAATEMRSRKRRRKTDRELDPTV